MAETFHLTVNDEQTHLSAAQLLAPVAKLSQQQLKDAMSKGAVWLTHQSHTRRLRRQKTHLQASDQLHLYLNPALLAEQALQPELLADEQQFSVWIKPAGMRSQGSKWCDHTSLPRVVETRLQRPAFLVHRLDRAASGLMLLAHSKKMARQLSALFESRQIEKRYKVSVLGRFPSDTTRIEQPLDEKPAVSIVEQVAHNADTSDLLIRIETGRKHQIRRHLAALGHPVLGDRLYGTDEQHDLQLKAVSLSFQLPGSPWKHEYQTP